MISKAETQYNAFVKQLKLGPNINLMPPKNFEGMTYTLTIRFDNRKELKNLKEKLEKIILWYDYIVKKLNATQLQHILKQPRDGLA